YANRYFWRFVQVEFMADVVESVNKDERLPRRHPWREFKLFKDSHDLVRVDKRLANADLDYEMRYPLAVPRCQLVASYILFIHKLLHHPGANHTWSYIRQHFVILDGYGYVRSLLAKCFGCNKANKHKFDPEPSPLPMERVRSDTGHAFEYVGLDLFGPLYSDVKRRRKHF